MHYLFNHTHTVNSIVRELLKDGCSFSVVYNANKKKQIKVSVSEKDEEKFRELVDRALATYQELEE